ncbi:MAG: DNA-directed DNA polymerase II small subunit [Candidatus Micrarchaeota archaeon]
MELEELIKRMNDADMFISPDALKLLKELNDLEYVAEQIISNADFVITKENIENLLMKRDEKKIPVPVEINRSPEFKPLAAEYDAEINIDHMKDVSGKSKCTGGIDNFVEYFRSRFRQTEAMLKIRVHKNGIISTKALDGYGNGTRVRVIGMVNSKRRTKKGHIFIELEDEQGTAKVLVLESKQEPEKSCFEKANSLLLDEVIAVDGRISDPFLMAEDIVWPDLPVREQKLCEQDLSIAFLSDLHIGSKDFMEKNFRKMIQWLNGGANGEGHAEMAGKIKYILIAGDLVDGIGIYPNQEDDLSINDVYEQYAMLSKYLKEIPEYIEIIVSPGNHDAVRRAEPQPKLPEALTEAINDLGNIHFVGNPASIKIGGLRTVIYHGTSLDSIIAAMPGCNYKQPEKPMLELLKRRNLSPIYGENPIVPEDCDYMVVSEPPDIVHMGHIHKNGYMLYRGMSLINSGTWQARTSFQIKQGHVPSPCLMPVYEMSKGKTSIVSFETKTVAQ